MPDLPHIWFKDGWEQMTWVDPDAYIAWKHNGIGEPNSLDFHVSEWVNARWRARRQGNL